MYGIAPVPFLLTIRHDTEAANDHFGERKVLRFATSPVRVGSSPEAECRVADETFPGRAFAIVDSAGQLHLEPQSAVPLLTTGEAAAAGTELLSGDELRVGQWSFVIHKIYGDPEDRRRRTGLGRLARAMMLAVLLAELGVVVWLPRQVAAAARRGHELARLRVFGQVDELRGRADRLARAEQETADPFAQALRWAITEDLDRRARYLRKHQYDLGPGQSQRMQQELQILAAALDRFDTGRFLQPIPPVDLEAAVRATLVRAQWSANDP